jgi:hypothetical protein
MPQPVLFMLSGLMAGSPTLGIPAIVPGLQPFQPPTYYKVSGVTRDETGAALAGCVVNLLRTRDNLLIGQTTSDGTGYYEFRTAGPASNYYVNAYKEGSPDVAGTTVNTVVGTG